MRIHAVLILIVSMSFLSRPQIVFAFDLHSSSTVEKERSRKEEIDAELSKLKKLSLFELDRYYETELAKNPDAKAAEIVAFVKQRLLDENLKLGTFQGYLRASQVSENPRYVADHQDLAKTAEDKKRLEQTIVLYSDANQLFNSNFKATHLGSIAKKHINHPDVFNDSSDEDKQEIAGVLSVFRAKKTSKLIVLGNYRLTVKITAHLPSRYTRTSKVLGKADKNLDYTEDKEAVIDIAPPNMSAQRNIDLGQVELGVIKYGSFGGIEERKATQAPSFTTKIVKVEVQ